jgi:hypothetical protein
MHLQLSRHPFGRSQSKLVFPTNLFELLKARRPPGNHLPSSATDSNTTGPSRPDGSNG